jgi:predicted ribosome quality control (RQC) complex YloA/Tae2 family protein
MELTSLDLSIIMEDLKQLEEGFVQKVYQRKEELTIEVYVPGDGKKRLILGPSYGFLSKYKRENPTRPPGFCMELRKHLGRIDKIYQRGFDRMLVIESGDAVFTAEIFGKGNFILEKDDTIIGAFRQEEFADRAVVVSEEYNMPDPTTDPRELDDIFEVMEGELVRSLAADLSLGGTYAEEIVARTGLDKEVEVSELSDEQKQKVRDEVQKMIDAAQDTDSVMYKDGEELIRSSPFPLQTYQDYDKEGFESFSEALDEFYYRRQTRKKKRKKKEKFEEKKQGILSQKEQQERKIQGLQKSSEQNRKTAELIYENYGDLHEIQKAIEKGIEEHGWKETEQRFNESDNDLAERVNSFNEREEFISVTVEDETVKIEPGVDLEAIASKYYDKAKESESKIESARKALEKTEKKLAELEEEDIEYEESMEDKTQKRSKKWFEKYRWFYSSEDHLICAGRDAQTNEMLVKKHMQDNDLYFHADFDGAPSVVVKDGKDAGEKTLEEAAKAAVTFSKTWKAGIGADTVYYVEPDQVTKNPESGEYLAKGGFVIRGDREYMRNVKVDACVGVYTVDEVPVPMCGPKSAVEAHCDTWVKLETGRKKKSVVAKEINRRFADEGYDLDLDYIIRVLPPGESEIKE